MPKKTSTKKTKKVSAMRSKISSSWAKRLKEKAFPWGGRVVVAPFPAHGTVSIVGSVAGGSYAFASEELAKIHAEMLLEGTMTHSKKELQILLDSYGASLTFSSTAERLVFSARVPLQHAEKLTALIAEILREPSFPSRELATLKKREEAALALEAQETRAQAQIALSRMLYPEGHPNRDETIDEARQQLQDSDTALLRKHHHQMISRASLIISFAGDMAPEKAWAVIEKHFKKLPALAIQSTSSKHAAAQKVKGAVVAIKHKASIDYMVGLATGITKHHPDYPALVLGVQILGNAGGFTGRLMKAVREEKGLTYGVYAYLSGFSGDLDGLLSVWGTFAPELFAKGRQAIRDEIEKIVAQGATTEEVRKHRELFAARAQVRLSTSGALALAAHETLLDGYPLSQLDEFPKKILALTPKAVHAALTKYLVPEKLSEAAAGPLSEEALDREVQ